MASTEEKVEFARQILHTQARYWNNDQPIFIPLSHLDESQLEDLVGQSETDYRTHEYLRAWLAGELGQPLPSRLPAALIPFVQRLAGGRGPDGRGKKLPPPSRELLHACAAALKEEYGCALYSGHLDGTACDYIGQAIGLKPERIKRLLSGSTKLGLSSDPEPPAI